MDNKEIRLRNLRMLIARSGGIQAEFARSIGKKANYLNQLLKGWQGRGMGTQLARLIEQQIGKPKGWMDTPHSIEWRESEAKNMSASAQPLHPALTRIGSQIAARIEALQDERSIDQVISLLDILEDVERRKGSPRPPDRPSKKS